MTLFLAGIVSLLSPVFCSALTGYNRALKKGTIITVIRLRAMTCNLHNPGASLAAQDPLISQNLTKDPQDSLWFPAKQGFGGQNVITDRPLADG